MTYIVQEYDLDDAHVASVRLLGASRMDIRTCLATS